MIKLRNVSKEAISEEFPFVGVITIKPGKTKDVPEDVAAAWLDPVRQEVRVEVVEEAAEEEKSEKPAGGNKKITAAE